MKILILTNSIGGLHSFRKEVVKELIDYGASISISSPLGDKAQYFEEIGCKLINTQIENRGLNPLSDFKLLMTYRKILKVELPDIVLSYTIKPNLYGGFVCQLCGIPQIANITGLGVAVENSGFLQKITIILYKIGLRKVHTVFFQNEANRLFCEQHNMVNGDKKLLPGSGVNLSFHYFQEYPSQTTPLRFIFISRLIREKGIDLYLSAAKVIKRKYPEIEFHVIGSGENEIVECIEKMHKEGIVIFHGRQPDVRPFIGRCHCTIHPSFYPEGMSNVLLESCAAGRPIITTDRPGCKEIVEEGVNGFIVRQRDVDDLINKIQHFISLDYDVKCNMALAARKKVENEFDRQIVVQAYLNEVKKIAG